MKRQDLIDNIEGSKLKKQFFEAFMLQSTFVEGLLKKLMEDDLFSNVEFPLIRQRLTEKGASEAFDLPKQFSLMKERLLRSNLYEMIEYLHKVDVIDNDLRKDLQTYREKRNNVIHDLVGNLSRSEFETELMELVVKGQNILNNTAMVKASESIQKMEEWREAMESNDPDAINKLWQNTQVES